MIRTALLALLLPWLAVAARWPGEFALPGLPLPGPGFAGGSGFAVTDWNDDGLPDLFMDDTGSVGKGTIYLNTGSIGDPRFGHGFDYPYNCTETVPQTFEHVLARTWCDLNHDGLADLILFDGQLRFCPNTGAAHRPFHWQLWPAPPDYFPGTPAMIRDNARYATGPESMFWNKGIFARQVITFTAADWDGDGLEDLLICRFDEEAPGVRSLGVHEQWTAWGRRGLQLPKETGLAEPDPAFLTPLVQAPARSLHFYRNTGTRETPHFDRGIPITTPDGAPIAAPNPVVADLDGDGQLDLLSTETRFSCNAFRVDWPTRPAAVWFRRPAADPGRLEPPRDLLDTAGKPIPAGTMLRLADLAADGRPELLVLDGTGVLRRYRREPGPAPRFAPPVELRGSDFPSFSFSVQPLVVDWFGPGSRDLIVHGVTDHHCKWGLRRTALFRNLAPAAASPRYEFAGYFTWRGDPALVPVREEERPYEVYGSAIAVAPPGPDGRRALLASVGGKHYWLSDLADDGLTFRQLDRLDLPQQANRHRGWQEIPVNLDFPVRYLRLGNDRNGMGNLRDGMLHLLHLELWSGGRNLAQPGQMTISKTNTETVRWYQIQRPDNFLDPANANTHRELRATSWGYYIGPAIIELAQPARLDRVRFELSERDSGWYEWIVPFSWQGKHYRMGCEVGEPWYQYQLEASADGQTWTMLADRLGTEIFTSFPRLLDWDGDGATDLLLGVTASKGIYPQSKQYRLYRNEGTSAQPRFSAPRIATLEDGKPLTVQADWLATPANQAGVAAVDVDGDGQLDLVVEGLKQSELRWFRQTGDFRFAPGGIVAAAGQPLRYHGRYRFFDLADVDGDGVLDWLDSSDGRFTWFPGQAGPVAPPPAGTAVAPLTAGNLGDSRERVLTVRAPTVKGAKSCAVLLRFPVPTGAFGRAELRLCADRDAQPDPGAMPNRLVEEISCVEVPLDYTGDAPATAGRFIAFAAPVFTIDRASWRTWNVTAAARAAQREGRDLCLLLRYDYTGHYAAERHNTFAGLDWPVADRRPHLLLTPAAEVRP